MQSRVLLRLFLSRQQCELVATTGYRQFSGSNLYSKRGIFCERSQVRFRSKIETDSLLNPSKTFETCDYTELKTTASVSSRREHLVLAMKDTFQISDEEANAIMQVHPSLWKCYFLKTFPLLKEVGLTKGTFVKYPWLSAIIQERILHNLQAVNAIYPEWSDINICAPLLYFTAELPSRLNFWQKEAVGTRYRSKFHFMADKLEVDFEEILKNIHSKKFLTTIPFQTLEININLLLEAGIKKEQIIHDMWPLKNSSNFIRKRLQIVVESGIPIKMWYFRCNIYTLERSIKSSLETKNALGDAPDFATFLSQLLQCSKETTYSILERNPKIKKCMPGRLKSITNMLVRHGIPHNQIALCPFVLLGSYETMERRILQLRSLKIPLVALSTLIAGEKNFQKFIENW